MNQERSTLGRLRAGVGIWTTTLDSVPPSHCGDVAAELETLGFAALWFAEAWGREAFTSASLLLGSTSRIVIASGIANIWARDAVSTANATKTLAAAYDDRFLLGLGVSHQPLVERLRGHDYVSPVAAMEEFLVAMDAAPMFAHEGEQPTTRVIAALGPKMLDVGARHADGVFPYLVTPAHTAIARAAVGNKFVAVEQAVVLGESREEFLRLAHSHLEIYTGLENYRNSWRRLGFSDDDFVRGGSERLCDAMVVHGDEAVVIARIDEHRAAGADHVCLQVLAGDLLQPPLDQWRRLAAALSS